MSTERHPSEESGRTFEPRPSGGVDANAPVPPVAIPDHELLRCIGRGSYGVVWLARHSMGMYRAVKIVFRQSFKDGRPFERELSGIRKFEPISRSHEGFVDVLHVGLNEALGCFYCVMELGDDELSGQNIDPDRYTPKTLSREISRRGKLTVEESLQLGMALCQALGELHKQGLAHRDVKPSNIIYLNGTPKLADIGLVAPIKDALSYVGTEGFIPPEGPGTAQADIFSLGKTLYEASTGRDRADFPELPSQWDKSSEHEKLLELNEVILHACKRDASTRYQSAQEMHADLVVAANGKSVRRLKQLERWVSNAKRAVSVTGFVVLVAAAISWQVYRESKVSLERRERQVGASVAYGNRAMDLGDGSSALSYFADALRLNKADQGGENFQWLRFNSVFSQSPKLVQMFSFPKEIMSVSFSPDGQQILAAERWGKVQVFDIATAKPVSPRFGQPYGVRWGTYSPDGKLVVTASEDQTACVWNAADGSIVQPLEHTNKVLCAAFSPDGSRLITACNDTIARVWDTGTWEVVLELKGHTQPILFVGFSRDAKSIVTTSRDFTARLWDATDGHQIGWPLMHGNWVYYASFSPDGTTLVTACFDRKARFWYLASRRQIPPDLEHLDGVNSAEFSPDGRLVVTAGLDRVARIWLSETHQPYGRAPVLRHSDRVTHAMFCSEGRRIVTTCADGTVRVWDLAGSAVAPPRLRFLFSEDKSRFVTVTNNTLQVWDTLSRQKGSQLIRPVHLVEEEELSPDGRFVLTLSRPTDESNPSLRMLEVWKSQTGERIGQPLQLTNNTNHVRLSPDGARLLVCEGPFVRTWDVLTGKPLSQLVKHDGTVQGAVFDPGGETVASWGVGFVKVWRATTGEPCFKPLKFPLQDTCAEFSPDGSRLVAGGAEGNFEKCYAQVLVSKTGQPVGAPMNHGDGVVSASFSPDGRWVVTASEDFTAIVWDADTGRQLTLPMRHADKVRSAVFSPDGKWIVTVCDDKTARIWRAETGEPLTPPLRHLFRPTEAQFLAKGTELVTSDLRGNSWVWRLPLERRPVEDCVRFGRLLSGDTGGPLADLGAEKSESLSFLWERLRTTYPSQFQTSPEEIDAWHEVMADESEQAGLWFPAAFHLKWLSASRPGDQLISNRLAWVTEILDLLPRP